MQVEKTRLTYICNMVTHIQISVKPASKVLDLTARFNIHSLQFVKLLASSNNNNLSLIVLS